MSSLQSTIEQLEVIFKKANDRFFNGELQKPVIAVNHDSSNSCFGWLTTWKAWQKEGTEGYYEINMCAEHLRRPLEQLVGTLIHEMVHLWNLQMGVKDTSRGGTYHNKKFKIEAEQRGLHIEQHAKYGWTLTTLNEEGQAFVESLGENPFGLYRTPITKSESSSSKKKSSSRKYVCPQCQQSIRATKEVRLYCGECTTEDELVLMELEEGEDE